MFTRWYRFAVVIIIIGSAVHCAAVQADDLQSQNPPERLRDDSAGPVRTDLSERDYSDQERVFLGHGLSSGEGSVRKYRKLVKTGSIMTAVGVPFALVGIALLFQINMDQYDKPDCVDSCQESKSWAGVGALFASIPIIAGGVLAGAGLIMVSIGYSGINPKASQQSVLEERTAREMEGWRSDEHPRSPNKSKTASSRPRDIPSSTIAVSPLVGYKTGGLVLRMSF